MRYLGQSVFELERADQGGAVLTAEDMLDRVSYILVDGETMMWYFCLLVELQGIS